MSTIKLHIKENDSDSVTLDVDNFHKRTDYLDLMQTDDNNEIVFYGIIGKKERLFFNVNKENIKEINNFVCEPNFYITICNTLFKCMNLFIEDATGSLNVRCSVFVTKETILKQSK